MRQKTFLFCAGFFGFVSVAAGAFGAHGLSGRLSPEDMAIFETAVRYGLVHALALLVVSVNSSGEFSGWLYRASWAFFIGTVIFSGSLYLLVFTQVRKWGMVTPVGGMALLFGWLAIVFEGLTRQGKKGAKTHA